MIKSTLLRFKFLTLKFNDVENKLISCVYLKSFLKLLSLFQKNILQT